MKDLLKVKRVVTHSGKFHTDDVLSTVLIRKFNPCISIVRVSEYKTDDSKEDEIVFDIGLGKFDHHNEQKEINNFGFPYSSFGKLWREYGREYLKNYGFNKVELAFNKFNEEIVSKVDYGDNLGYQNIRPIFLENYLIIKFNPTWYEKKSNKSISDIQFLEAVKFAELLFQNWIRSLYEKIELYEIEKKMWEKAISKEQDGIVVLEEKIPWQIFLKDNRSVNIKFIILKNDRGGYCAISKNCNKYKIKDSTYFSYIHPSQFVGVADSLEKAILGVKYSLNCISS